ncbi:MULTISPECIES: ImmA/IrrE family metallo-endopeptidase [Clostridia]|uniref:ArdC-like ssDNA-binding domain-containing protein n=1 Tax=Clostridia TaxID=186801 RepID=UPI000EA39A8F|nr:MULTISPECIES: ImmA/IrrE family metallo-endopeptidase [Clostridia]NBJ68737.1 ImmA/IrrE family metallo-endopeptidase [Roseburia sp. 1XD42-34]RKI80591.1 ImmA/IrrE family metallo-endopeptidase [Clostridium sp. 1xD42-85]
MRSNKIDKKQQVEQLTNEMNQAIENYFATPEQLKEYLAFMGNFYQYSLRNTALIHSQFQGARAVGSFKFWKEKGFPVKKGEKGIQILVPNKTVPKFKTEDGKWKHMRDATDEEKEKLEANQLEKKRSRLYFSIGHVFDISQTEATSSDLPHIFPNKWLDGQVENYKDTMEILKILANEMKVSVGEPFEELGAAKGAFYYGVSGKENGHIGLNPRNSEVQNVKTLLHELAHAKLHHVKHENHYKLSTAEKEFQAEMTAYTVASYFGIDTSDYSLSYLANWTKGKDLQDKEKLLQEVRQTATEFIEAMEEGMELKCMQNDHEVNKDAIHDTEKFILLQHGSFGKIDIFEFNKTEVREKLGIKSINDLHSFNKKYAKEYTLIDPSVIREPTVVIKWSEAGHKLEPNAFIPLKEADEIMKG